jgi:perosamine synthetase
MNRISDLERKYVLEVLDNKFRTSLNSVFVSRLEKQFAEKFNCSFAISHVNGTATMHTALSALGVGAGDEVIVPPLTMSSTALSVLHNQSIPVFADVDRDSFNLDPESVRKSITPRTKAIIVVALYGLSPDYDEIMRVCRDHQLFLIEDNAECFLGYYKGQLVGSFGDFSSFSFQASKHMTCGEGGILTTNDEELANKARRFSSLGYAAVSSKKGKIPKRDIQNPDYDRHITVGFNYRMSEVNAAVALGQLERLEILVEQRKKVADLFESAVKGFAFVRPQFTPKYCLNSYWTYAMVLETDKGPNDWYSFRDLFQENGGDHYYAAWKLSYNEPLFQNIIQKESGVWQKYKPGLCPNAEYLQLRMIQLKTNYWNISEAEKQADILHKTLSEFGR